MLRSELDTPFVIVDIEKTEATSPSCRQSPIAPASRCVRIARRTRCLGWRSGKRGREQSAQPRPSWEKLVWLTEEHGMVAVPPEYRDRLRVGDRLEVVPLHACGVINICDEIAVVRGPVVEAIELVVARGKFRCFRGSCPRHTSQREPDGSGIVTR